jgi:hypothetical protein
MARFVRVMCLLVILALWLTLGFFWWRSSRVMDEWSTVDQRNTLRAVVSYRGALHFIRAGKNSTPRKIGWDTQQIPKDATLRELHLGRGVVWAKAGFVRFSAAAPTLPPAGMTPAMWRAMRAQRRVPAVAAPPPPTMSAIAPWLLTYPYDAWVVPYWAAFVVVSLPLVRGAFVVARRRHRRRHGRCVRCGYDLRETPQRCPECGQDAGSGDEAAVKTAGSAMPARRPP